MNTHPLRFTRAVQALVSAYFNDTLAKGNCCACAVGNICAAALDTKVFKKHRSFDWMKGFAQWDRVFATANFCGQAINEFAYRGEAKRQIDATGYSWQELARVEKAFESNTKIYYGDYWLYTEKQIETDQYNGLMAVVDVLCQIEGISDPGPTKALFVKPASPVASASV